MKQAKAHKIKIYTGFESDSSQDLKSESDDKDSSHSKDDDISPDMKKNSKTMRTAKQTKNLAENPAQSAIISPWVSWTSFSLKKNSLWLLNKGHFSPLLLIKQRVNFYLANLS